MARPPFPPDVYIPQDVVDKCLTAVTRYLYRVSSGDCFSYEYISNDHSTENHSSSGSNHGATTKRVTFDNQASKGKFDRDHCRRESRYNTKKEIYSDQNCFDKICGLSEQEWESILSASYRLVVGMRGGERDLSHNRIVPMMAILRHKNSTPRQIRAALLLRSLEIEDCQYFMNGARNIWVVKVCLPVN